jgi:hypothetical protein
MSIRVVDAATSQRRLDVPLVDGGAGSSDLRFAAAVAEFALLLRGEAAGGVTSRLRLARPNHADASLNTEQFEAFGA